jgi:thiol-disulfide isomerase/thioredoxin
MKKLILSVSLSLLFLFSFDPGDEAFAQQRNPVLEYCTGTWCPNCPAGHQIINNTILPNIPNAIIIGYHGPANGSDPFSFFPGNSIINTLLRVGGSTGYPTGTIDRTSGVQSRSAWYGYMNTRNSVPATVAIDINRSFNTGNREFNATIDFTALTNLNGQYKFNVILLESGMVWAQSGGTSNYVHKHVVRSMMNGALGEEVINGTWNQNDVITKTINYTVPVPGGLGPDIIWDSCNVVVMVYKVGSPLNSNAEIQQAEEWTLLTPDYVATIASMSPDIIGDNNTPVSFDAVIYNEGLLTDKYDISLSFDGPAGWVLEFTTENGTFPLGQTDSVEVNPGESTTITVTVDPDGIDGAGTSTLEFVSKFNAGNQGSVVMRNVTTSGNDFLVVDATEEGNSSYIANSFDNVHTGTYGVISRTALQDPTVDLSNFYLITWSAGVAIPAFLPEEVANLEGYLDNGGRLFLNGQDIGEDIFEPTGQSHHAQSFYNNYLYANYVASNSSAHFIIGFDGDPITDGMSFVLNDVYEKNPDVVSRFNAQYADSIFKYSIFDEAGGLRVETINYRAVYLAFSFEQIPAEEDRDTIMNRTMNWLLDGISSAGSNNLVVNSFNLEQNYPNPFNPSTTITYSLANEEHVSLKVFDIMGREVAELVNEDQTAGTYSLDFDASSLASGMYFYKISAGNFVSTKKMVLLK